MMAAANLEIRQAPPNPMQGACPEPGFEFRFLRIEAPTALEDRMKEYLLHNIFGLCIVQAAACNIQDHPIIPAEDFVKSVVATVDDEHHQVFIRELCEHTLRSGQEFILGRFYTAKIVLVLRTLVGFRTV